VKQKIKCPSCSFENDFSFKFCSQCGSPLHEIFEETERRRVTCLFVDLAGFTRLSTIIEPEDLKNLLDTVFGEVASIIEENGGYIDKFLGDAVLAVFGAPFAVRGAVKRALESALLINEKKFNFPHQIKFHFGIATGEVVYGKVGAKGEKTVLGDAVNFASRLEDLSEPGEILADEETFEEGKDEFDFEFLGEKEIRGKGKQKIYRLLDKKKFRIEKIKFPFINRKEEKDLIKKFISAEEKNLLIITGSQGVGKTYLAKEIQKISGFQSFYVDSQGLRKISLGLLKKIKEKLNLKGEIPEKIDSRILQENFIISLNEKYEKDKFLIIIDTIEEADIDSVRILKNTIKNIKAKFILITRTENFENLKTLFENFETLELKPLKREDFERLCFETGLRDTPLINELYERFGGIPLNLEIFIDYSISKGLILKEEKELKINFELKREIFPPTIRELYLIKFDLLNPFEKWLLKRCACAGFKFEPDLIETVINQHIEKNLEELKLKGFLNKENGKFRFYDYSLFESIYSVINKRTKEEIHKKILDELLKKEKEDPEYFSRIAWHFYEINDTEKGNYYNLKAAKLYKERGAIFEAYEIYSKIIDETDEREKLREILPDFFEISYRTSEFESIESAFNKWGEKDDTVYPLYLSYKSLILKDRGNPEQGLNKLEEFYKKESVNEKIKGKILVTLAQLSFFSRDFEKTTKYAKEVRQKTKDLRDILSSLLVEANVNAINFNFEKAIEIYKRACDIAEKINEKYLLASILNNLNYAYLSTGKLQSAYESAERAIEISREIGARGPEVSSYISMGRTLLYLYSYKEAEEYLLKARLISGYLGRINTYLNASLNLIYCYRQLNDTQNFYKIYGETEEMFEKSDFYSTLFNMERLLLERKFEDLENLLNKLPEWDRDQYILETCLIHHFNNNRVKCMENLKKIKEENLNIFGKFMYYSLLSHYFNDPEKKEKAKKIFTEIIKEIKERKYLKNFLEDKFVKWFIREFNVT